MNNECILTLDVGNGVVIQDVQLWGNSAETLLPKKGKARVVAHVDTRKLPLWVRSRDIFTCFSSSSTTAAYFRAKLLKDRHAHRGIVVEVGKLYLVFFKSERSPSTFQIECVRLDLALKRKFDTQLLQASTVSSQSLMSPHIDDIVAKQSLARAESSLRISRHVQVADYRRHFSSTASSCILGGLRLRGIRESETDYHKIYKTAYLAVEFAFRNELSNAHPPISFEQVQETVETLLKVFTRS
ncbi:LAQU0S20e00188g1_1 [Lachancea quebecensis]|uniref:Mitochondrial morphogenesis protein SLD7 n=1 Tax=Lachancea quebecensis TaxID=1654605 RepID=A0A0P1KXK6_9SACH|nr:LAQU0S20e00188g1_1 [Lachancea quebecensis]